MALAIVGCIDESPTPVVFDQELESTTFRNRLLTPVILFRNGDVLDTLAAQTTLTYPLGVKGVIMHSWRILAPLGNDARPAGIEPTVDIGIQYAINADYTIDNESVPGETIFTPRIGNFSSRDLRLTANYREDDQFATSLVIPRNTLSSLTHSPYFYWHSSSNIYLDDVAGPATYRFSRDTSDGERPLILDDSSRTYEGAGATLPLVAN
jgi:hypothetical protein